MARHKKVTLTKHDTADTALLISTYISTGRLKVTKCPEFRRTNLNPKRSGGMMPSHLNPLYLPDLEPCPA